MHASTIAIAAAALVAPALAQQFPYNDESYKNGNSFATPNKADEPVIGKPFTVKWAPTLQTAHGSCNKVSIELLYGKDATSLVPNATLANDISNSGSFSWTPASTLTPAEAQYGLRLTCAVSQDYQYTVLFGIKKGDGQTPSPSSVSSTTSVSTTSLVSSNSTSPAITIADATMTTPEAQATIWSTAVVSHLTTYCPAATTLAFNSVTYTVTEATWLTVTDCPCTISYAKAAQTSTPLSIVTPYPIPNNTTVVMPTGSNPPAMTTTLSTAAGADATTQGGSTPSVPAGSLGAASSLKVSAFGAFVAVAVAALAL